MMTDFNQEYIDYFGGTLKAVQIIYNHFETMFVGDEVLLSQLVDITGDSAGEVFGAVTYLVRHENIADLIFYEVIDNRHVEVRSSKYIDENEDKILMKYSRK